MKNKLFIILLSFFNFFSFSQDKEMKRIFKNPFNWETEIIDFPIDWAPNLHFKGFEELVFAPNWSNPKHEEFWSLVIVYSVEAKNPVTISEIENNFKAYFDGLMKPNHWSQNFPNPIVKFKLNQENSNLSFTGTMQVFDGFHSGKVINLNIKGEQYFCEKLKKSVIKFSISTKKTNHKIWKTLKQVKVKRSICEVKHLKLIDIDTTWTKEIFEFPISFAPKLPYQGFEEAHFPPEGWSDEKHLYFWSYVFAWNINLDTKYTKDHLENDIKVYFDGLNRNENFETTASFTKVKEKENTTYFRGKVAIYDNFKTKKPLQLNVLVESTLCNKKSLILFKFSPKDYKHQTWETLQTIQLKKVDCN